MNCRSGAEEHNWQACKFCGAQRSWIWADDEAEAER